MIRGTIRLVCFYLFRSRIWSYYLLSGYTVYCNINYINIRTETRIVSYIQGTFVFLNIREQRDPRELCGSCPEPWTIREVFVTNEIIAH